MLSIWHDIDSALKPIIGMRGVAALYVRSVHLSVPGYPWLEGTYANMEKTLNAEPLKAVLLQQDRDDALAAGEALLQAFDRLLCSLIGVSLAEQLLRPVWETSPADPPARTFP
jgi:hypothetical protein